MKKVTGFFFITAAILLLGSSFKPFADEVPNFSKIEAPAQEIAADELPRLFKIEESSKNDTQIKKLADELPRLF
ncbi:hypothetical protein [Exiguobacterium sp.]|uniref:hypothetical protein n=1 Tax=Exiguobacterium sp. TaxID=44751 RepID=UPI0039195B1E